MWNPLADMPRATDDRVRRAPTLEAPGADSALDAADEGSQEQVEEELSSQAISAIFGSSQRSGAWESADQIRARAYFGEVKLDFRDAILPLSGIVEVYATAVFGGVDVIVPKGADVEVESRAVVFGEVGLRSRSRTTRACSSGFRDRPSSVR